MLAGFLSFFLKREDWRPAGRQHSAVDRSGQVLAPGVRVLGARPVAPCAHEEAAAARELQAAEKDVACGCFGGDTVGAVAPRHKRDGREQPAECGVEENLRVSLDRSDPVAVRPHPPIQLGGICATFELGDERVVRRVADFDVAVPV